MNDLYINVIGFIACTASIVFSGTRLTKHGDTIAELTGWGRAWVGLIMMASVTSLPELMTGISSVAILDMPNLAAGDIFGSCVFNLLILSFIDARISQPITSLVKSSHLFAGLISIILLGLSGIAIVVSDITPVIFWISPFSILLGIVYFIAIAGIFKFEHLNGLRDVGSNITTTERKLRLRKVLISYFLNAILVIAAAMFLPYFGQNIADTTGVGNTFFGTLFLAASTSLPELVVSFSAIRMRTFDLLLGNLLGSNIFNVFILALDDIFYTKGSLFANINVAHIDTVITVMIMTAIVGTGLVFRQSKKFWRLSFDTFLIVLLYAGLMIVLYLKK